MSGKKKGFLSRANVYAFGIAVGIPLIYYLVIFSFFMFIWFMDTFYFRGISKYPAAFSIAAIVLMIAIFIDRKRIYQGICWLFSRISAFMLTCVIIAISYHIEFLVISFPLFWRFIFFFLDVMQYSGAYMVLRRKKCAAVIFTLPTAAFACFYCYSYYLTGNHSVIYRAFIMLFTRTIALIFAWLDVFCNRSEHITVNSAGSDKMFVESQSEANVHQTVSTASANDLLKEGNALYKAGDYIGALEKYQESYKLSGSEKLKAFIEKLKNLLRARARVREANALYKNKKYYEALDAYQESLIYQKSEKVERFVQSLQAKLQKQQSSR